MSDKQWKIIDYFHYEMLRKRWQQILHTKLKKSLPKTRENKRPIDEMYRQQKEGFYVHTKNRMHNAKGAAKYIGRYVSRPAIARIFLQRNEHLNRRSLFLTHFSLKVYRKVRGYG
ncbi:transposase [Desulfosporosinus sp. SB140]|uniref:transposase n=1 Tax=Desulfosporosinus paludis TaxID=3115649 RepID=UPI003890B7FF